MSGRVEPRRKRYDAVLCRVPEVAITQQASVQRLMCERDAWAVQYRVRLIARPRECGLFELDSHLVVPAEQADQVTRGD
jgi:hypothetical protein